MTTHQVNLSHLPPLKDGDVLCMEGVRIEPLQDTVACDAKGRIPKQDPAPVPKRKGDWMLTAGGTAYWPLDPRASEVFITDIAHSLALQCRYGGHSQQFYSVAEHCVHVSRLVPPEHALVALLHDATEAYVSDVPRPLKPWLKEFDDIEFINWCVICDAFDLGQPALPECVTDVDRRICLTEMAQLLPAPPLPLGIDGEAPDIRLPCWSPENAKREFLGRFTGLWDARLRARHPAANHRKVA